MFILCLKIILALVLTTIPFTYAYYIRPRKDKPGVWRNGFTAVASQFPYIRKLVVSIWKCTRRLYDGMKKWDSFRKFYGMMILLAIIAYQYTDFHAASYTVQVAKEFVENSGEKYIEMSAEKYKTIRAVAPFLTQPFATLLAACLGLLLFSYRITDRLLSCLHKNQKVFFFWGLFIMVILTTSTRYFILAETMDIILLAAFFYPTKIPDSLPKGRKRLPENQRKESVLKMAA